MILKEQSIVVFGGSGFLGRYVVRRLARLGARIKIISRYPQEAAYLKPMGEVGQIEFIRSDFYYTAVYPKIIDGATIVINLVGIMHPRGKNTFDQIHHVAPADLANACAQKNVEKFIHISALGSDLKSQSQYAQSKFRGEQAILSAYPNAHILRPSLLFGPEDQFFNLFAKLLRYSPVMPLFYKGQTKFQPVFVDDVAYAIEKIITSNIKPGIYELGGNDIYSFKELLDFLQKTLGFSKHYISFPNFLERIIAFFGDYMPIDLITQDQLKLLYKDNVVCPDALSFKQLGITPKNLEEIVKSYVK